MAFFLRKSLKSPHHILSLARRVSTTILAKENSSINRDSGNSCTKRLHLSPLFFDGNGRDFTEDCKIELVDNEAWQVSSGLAEAWKCSTKGKGLSREDEEEDNSKGAPDLLNKEDPDFDEIEDMRVRGNLFYKIDKGSKEYQEYKFDFHRRNRKCSENQIDQKENTKKKDKQVGKDSKTKDERKEIKGKVRTTNSDLAVERFHGVVKNEDSFYGIHGLGGDFAGKKLRTPTFNQLTAPYHEPFCLDIYVSKGSVSASIIHRATSKVVAVAHSISKDMRFDLGSTKNKSTCAAVGEVLAQRALADDIHNVVYTPRKGEKLEGKLQIVLQSVIDHGMDVKVKIKQKKVKKGILFRQKVESNAD